LIHQGATRTRRRAGQLASPRFRYEKVMCFATIGGFVIALSMNTIAIAQIGSSTPQSTISVVAIPSPPTKSAAAVRDQLGKLDAAAQSIVRSSGDASMQSSATEITQTWPVVRSELVGLGASRSDLIAVDSAVRSLKTTIAAGADARRGANVLTAAFAPLYTSVGDRVPARVHRLDYLQRAMILDISDFDWTRANSDVISANSTWGTVRRLVVDRGAQHQADLYSGALNAVEDAINARDKARFARAITRADSALGTIEVAFDQQLPPWRQFLKKLGI